MIRSGTIDFIIRGPNNNYFNGLRFALQFFYFVCESCLTSSIARELLLHLYIGRSQAVGGRGRGWGKGGGPSYRTPTKKNPRFV